jgi:hypothetical protein
VVLFLPQNSGALFTLKKEAIPTDSFLSLKNVAQKFK